MRRVYKRTANVVRAISVIEHHIDDVGWLTPGLGTSSEEIRELLNGGLRREETTPPVEDLRKTWTNGLIAGAKDGEDPLRSVRDDRSSLSLRPKRKLGSTAGDAGLNSGVVGSNQ